MKTKKEGEQKGRQAGKIESGALSCPPLSIIYAPITVADPGKNLTGALQSNFGRGGCGGRG